MTLAASLPAFALDARLIGGTSTGDSTYWTGLLEGLIAIRPNARILLLSNASKPATIPLPSNFEWHQIAAPNSRMWSLVAFPAAARRLGARSIHTQYNLSPLAGDRGIATVHDVSFFVGPDWFRPKDRFLLRLGVPASVRRAKRVIAVSKTDRAEIERFMPFAAGKTEVVYNACPSWVRKVPVETAKERVAKTFGIEGPYVLTVGTRWPRKNMELAVSACDLLPDALPHRLLVTGKAGWGDQELGKRGKAVGYVSNEDLCDLYSGSDLYLAPSRHEGFGIPLLEAFRCGCPVLSSNGGALPEVAGGAAAIQNEWTPEAWAERMGALLGDSSKLDGLRQRGFAREREFSWEAAARQTLEIYMGVMH